MADTATSDFFDRVVVVNLARRPHRLTAFVKRLENWPFKYPVRFEAVDGYAATPPETWTAGKGAWGCQLSHRGVLRAALADGLKNILVLEDDAYPVPDFARRALEFVAKVPDDWDGLMLGAQHLRPPLPIGNGIVRCEASHRTHGFAVRGRFLKALHDVWGLNKTDHCDIVLSSLMRVFKVYAPDPLLIGQDAGDSDVNLRRESLVRFLNPDQLENIAKRDSKSGIDKLVTRVA
jgi:GR25 family glycosyltransferase involved in LPS biosynthesis